MIPAPFLFGWVRVLRALDYRPTTVKRGPGTPGPWRHELLRARTNASCQTRTVTIAPASEGATATATVSAEPWVAIVWNDPVNLMSYVAHIFMTVLGHSAHRAHELMLTVHEKGKATVLTGGRDDIERAVLSLQTAGLWATMAQTSSR